METATPPNESSLIESDVHDGETSSDLTRVSHFGQFSLYPTTQTTTVVTTTTVSTNFPPVIFRRPRKRLSDWDVTAYPLKNVPTPKELRRFTFEINGKVSEFMEKENPEHALAQLQDVIEKLHRSPSQKTVHEEVCSKQLSSNKNNNKQLKKRQHSEVLRSSLHHSPKRQHMTEARLVNHACDNRNNLVAPKPTRASRSMDLLNDISKPTPNLRNVALFEPTHVDDKVSIEPVEPSIQVDMTSPQSLSLPSPSASPRGFQRQDEQIDQGFQPAPGSSVHDSKLSNILNDHPQATSMLELPRILDTFDDLPQAVQSYLMYHLLRRCSKTTLQVVASIVNPALKRDFLDLLPYELSLQIISYLDARSLTRAAQVSRRWRQLVDEDEYTWKHRLESDQYYVADGEFELAVQQGWGVKKSAPSRGASHRLEGHSSNQNPLIVKTQFAEMVDSGLKQPLVGRHLYKAIYQKHHVDYNAWMNPQKKPRHLSFESHGRHVVTCLQLDDEKIITGSEDANINIFDVRTGELRMTLEGHEGGVWALQYIGNILVSGSTDRTVRIWDMTTGQCLQILEGHTSTVRCLQILPVRPDDTTTEAAHIIITGSRDSTLRIWRMPEIGHDGTTSMLTQVNSPDDTESPYCLRSLVGHSQSVRALAAEGDVLVSGSYDCSVRVWQISSGKCLWKLTGHTQKVYSVVLDYSQNRCISGSMDCKVKIWDIALGVCLHTLEGHTSLVGLLSLSHDRLVSAAADSTLRVWNPRTGRCMQSLTAHTGAITCFQHDGDKVISGSDGTLKLWDLKTGEFSRDLLVGLTYVWQVRFDERRCVAAVQRNNTTFIEVLDFGTNREVNTVM